MVRQLSPYCPATYAAETYKMKRTIAIIVLRMIGIQAGILGAIAIYGSLNFLLAQSDDMSLTARAAFAIPSLLFSAFFIWIAYLTWFRLSPRAVQQACGLLGFVVLVAFNSQFPPTSEANFLHRTLALLALLIVVLFGYRILSRYLNGIIFASGK